MVYPSKRGEAQRRDCIKMRLWSPPQHFTFLWKILIFSFSWALYTLQQVLHRTYLSSNLQLWRRWRRFPHSAIIQKASDSVPCNRSLYTAPHPYNMGAIFSLLKPSLASPPTSETKPSPLKPSDDTLPILANEKDLALLQPAPTSPPTPPTNNENYYTCVRFLLQLCLPSLLLHHASHSIVHHLLNTSPPHSKLT